MKRFDLNRALGALIVVSAWYSAYICSNWYGLVWSTSQESSFG